jgi:hypothetical protein
MGKELKELHQMAHTNLTFITQAYQMKTNNHNLQIKVLTKRINYRYQAINQFQRE